MSLEGNSLMSEKFAKAIAAQFFGQKGEAGMVTSCAFQKQKTSVCDVA